MNYRRLSVVVLCVLLLISLFPPNIVLAGTPISPPTVTQSIQAAWDREITYDWTLSKSVYPATLDIACGQQGSVTYQLNVARTKVSEQASALTISGSVTVKNNTGAPTEGLTILSRLLRDGVAISSQAVPASDLPAAGEATFPYSFFDIEKIDGALYEVETTVTVTNYPGHIGEQFGPGAVITSISIPNTPVRIWERNATANLTDTLACPVGFLCTPDGYSELGIAGSLNPQYTVTITNDNATCGSTAIVNNVATLEPLEGMPRTASAQVTISTGQCAGGCTRTIGYWKNHGSEIAPHLPLNLGSRMVSTTASAVDALNMKWGKPSNGITKLYAQLLAAKLNAANGADTWAVGEVISVADSFLQTHTENSWDSLSRELRMQVLEWMSDLDNYNNGLTGPGHCN